MSQLFPTINQLTGNHDLILRRSYGVIETRNGDFVSLKFKPWPKLISATEAAWAGAFRNSRVIKDRCRIFFNQPMGHRSYLALKYIESTLGTTMTTLRKCMEMLDEIAEIKRIDALLAHVTNSRISDRLMRRWGWERHLEQKSGRHFVKRFYGDYSNKLATLVARPRTNHSSPVEI